jgi:hypothetical protein
VSATSKPRYRVPVKIVDAEVALDEFDDEDIIEYLRHQGYIVSGKPCKYTTDGSEFLPEDLNHIFTLAVCGQQNEARSEALEMVSKAIGRPL